jgi:hypothetical protein
MCTVTLHARRDGYALGMNRDEKRTRAIALPPSLLRLGPRLALGPTEPGGGTWIGVNDHGVTLALINWYSVTTRVEGKAKSRGEVVLAALRALNGAQASERVARLPLPQINPFRLIGVFPAEQAVVEWQWDLRRLKEVRHPWRTATWISSGYDEPGAQRTRGAVFRAASRQSDAGSAVWLRRLHRSHRPKRGAYSICMHREDAVTVSYTEVQFANGTATMRYLSGSPCEATPERLATHQLATRGGASPARARTRPPARSRKPKAVSAALGARSTPRAPLP